MNGCFCTRNYRTLSGQSIPLYGLNIFSYLVHIYTQKESPRDALSKWCSKTFWKIHRKVSLSGSLFCTPPAEEYTYIFKRVYMYLCTHIYIFIQIQIHMKVWKQTDILAITIVNLCQPFTWDMPWMLHLFLNLAYLVPVLKWGRNNLNITCESSWNTYLRLSFWFRFN